VKLGLTPTADTARGCAEKPCSFINSNQRDITTTQRAPASLSKTAIADDDEAFGLNRYFGSFDGHVLVAPPQRV